jgi:hypothetical protein
VLTRRIVRAGLLGSALTVLTLAGHTSAGGALDVVGVGITALVALALAVALSARALSFPLLLAVLLAGQGLLHVLVTITAGHAHAAAGPSTDPVVMVVAHALAALVAAALITYADHLAARWQAFLATVLGASVPSLPTPSLSTRTGVPRADSAAGALVLLLHGVVRRGPPSSVASA